MLNINSKALTTVDNSYMIVWSVRRCQHLGDTLMLNRHIDIYGTTKIPRGYCSLCKDYAFIIDGIIQCCETLVVGSLSRKPKRMIEAEQVRRRPSKKAD